MSDDKPAKRKKPEPVVEQKPAATPEPKDDKKPEPKPTGPKYGIMNEPPK